MYWTYYFFFFCPDVAFKVKFTIFWGPVKHCTRDQQAPADCVCRCLPVPPIRAATEWQEDHWTTYRSLISALWVHWEKLLCELMPRPGGWTPAWPRSFWTVTVDAGRSPAHCVIGCNMFRKVNVFFNHLQSKAGYTHAVYPRNSHMGKHRLRVMQGSHLPYDCILTSPNPLENTDQRILVNGCKHWLNDHFSITNIQHSAGFCWRKQYTWTNSWPVHVKQHDFWSVYTLLKSQRAIHYILDIIQNK